MISSLVYPYFHQLLIITTIRLGVLHCHRLYCHESRDVSRLNFESLGLKTLSLGLGLGIDA